MYCSLTILTATTHPRNCPDRNARDVKHAKIVITNYHAFKLRERMEVSKGGRSLLQGRGEPSKTLETEGQMIQRVMPELMGYQEHPRY